MTIVNLRSTQVFKVPEVNQKRKMCNKTIHTNITTTIITTTTLAATITTSIITNTISILPTTTVRAITLTMLKTTIVIIMMTTMKVITEKSYFLWIQLLALQLILVQMLLKLLQIPPPVQTPPLPVPKSTIALVKRPSCHLLPFVQLRKNTSCTRCLSDRLVETDQNHNDECK